MPMIRIGGHLIYGSNPEPFLEAAIRSIGWVDYLCAINTAPGDAVAVQNEDVVKRTCQELNLELRHMRTNVGEGANFDFALARNLCLNMADPGDYVFLLDSDDVHYPEFEATVRELMAAGHDMITAHFWHLIGYKDLWGKEPHREIVFTLVDDGVHFTKAVHEGLEHPRANPALAGRYHYVHYGYIKPPREIFSRWVLYSQIEGDPNHYDGRNPDDALAGWLDGCQPFWQEHPPAVQELLKSYPPAPRSARAIEATRNIGLVMLTWNDAENLKDCLKTLTYTRQPFKLCVVDNGSSDATLGLICEFEESHQGSVEIITTYPPHSLAEALNIGFGHFMDDPEVDYIGWIHPDMVFERDTWLECLRHALDTHPDIAKVGAWELDTPRHPEPCPGNSQCYLVRKSALEQVGLFDERFLACGGYEDWEHNWRLLKVGKVMIWPDAIIRHNAMGTRKNHDNEAAARHNAEVYYSIVGTWSPVV